MPMSNNKKYYWLKLEVTFFDQTEIKRLRRMAGGDTYTIIYFKMLLLSLNEDGGLFYDGIGDDFTDELSLDIDEDLDDVKMTIAYLQSKGLLEIVSDKEYHLSALPEMVGSETDSARRMRRKRQRDSVPALKASHSDKLVTGSDTEIEKELELEKELETEIDSPTSKVLEVYNHYLTKGIIAHKKITSSMRSAINARLNDYTMDQLIEAIDNYATVYSSATYWFNTKYTLTDLMRDKDVRKFIDEAEPLNNFKSRGQMGGSNIANMEYDPEKDSF